MEISYNSCRNNNCPKCQGIKRRIWVAERMDELLDAPYFHTIFTIPDYFNPLHHTHYKELYNALFSASSSTLLVFFKKRGGVPAITAIAHSWGQTMCVHPHVHMLVTGGCLSFDEKRWINIGNNYLFDVRKLSAEFKRRFAKEIKKRVPDFQVPDTVYEKEWVVFTKKPVAGAEVVVKYLARYVNRSAIANSRIKAFSNGNVTFEYKNHKKTDADGKPAVENMTLAVDEFIRRFLQHVPPDNCRRSRFYGILAGRRRKEKTRVAKELALSANFALSGDDAIEQPEDEPSTHSCPECAAAAAMEIVETLLPHGPPHITFRNEVNRGSNVA
jgi:hypothetical protein